ncbi:carbohydrate ABC transporter permease [Paenibacillus sp. OV219]|uniref:carbohydrate ABC transporter permease n=1 Tax=Paenibacillus sp. OV219 TaxID=1884377 RepID=UPI0008B4A06D|nr:carbohydrate ABC transporter permease [Paenibacillus sp. OV219]SEO37753.1 carbohydrate ABC transporter membrane protein 2, CUT1 family [Paenibacillus sp. OV219]
MEKSALAVGNQVVVSQASTPIWRGTGRIVVYLVLILMSLLFLAPFLFMIGTAFKRYEDIVGDPLNPLPLHPSLANFSHLFDKLPFFAMLGNSLIIAVSLTALAIIFNALVAYGFSRYDFKFKHGLFVCMLATMMIPGQITLVPSFVMFRSFGMLDTFWPLILPGAVGAFGVFLIRQVMVAIPKEIYDSAKIDGCSELGTFFRIALPLSGSAVGIVGLLTFMGAWNDYLGPLIYLSSGSKMTLAVGLTTMVNPYKIDYASPITGALLMSVPVLVLLSIIGHKYFVDGLTAGSIKG